MRAKVDVIEREWKKFNFSLPTKQGAGDAPGPGKFLCCQAMKVRWV
jgi:hypothetical protein